FLLLLRPPSPSTLFPYTTLFRSCVDDSHGSPVEWSTDRAETRAHLWVRARSCRSMILGREHAHRRGRLGEAVRVHQSHGVRKQIDRKSTRLNSSHSQISYAVFCL